MTTADIIALVAAFGAIAAGAAAAWQAHLLRFSLKVQSLFVQEKRFNEPEYQRSRHLAARQLQMTQPESDVDDVLDFLDTLGLLVRRGAIDAEMVYHTFFYWVDGYYRAAFALIQRERRKNPRVWEDLPKLHERLLRIENRGGVKRQDTIAEFLEYEVRQCDEAQE